MKIKKKLEKSTKAKISKWGDEAVFRLRNRKWLRYSSNIARRILASIEERKDLNQKILAEKIGVKPQYINKVVKGQENLSLETIGKISDALGFELIHFPAYKYNRKKPKLTLPVGFLNRAMVQKHLSGPVHTVSTSNFYGGIQTIAGIKTA